MNKRSQPTHQQLANMVMLLFLVLAIRMLLLYTPSFDIYAYEAKWYDYFIKVGRIDAFKTVFYNYSPAFLYLIDITTLFRFIPKDIAIKLISIIADFFAAAAVYKLVDLRYRDNQNLKWAGFFVVLLAPTVFVESAMWGQNDIIFTSFLLWSLFFILSDKPLPAIFTFSIAFCFKLQAIFFAPIFVILFLHKKFLWYYAFVLPITYVISIVPAWLAGGPFDKLISMYFTQFGYFRSLSMRAPNLYLFIHNEPNYDRKVFVGIIVTCLIIAMYILMRWLQYKELSNSALVFDAAFFTILIPFLLPKMHERYFFAGCLMVIILAFFQPKFIWAAILLQASSLLSFIPYFSSWPDYFAQAGSILNLVLVVGFLAHAFRYHTRSKTTMLSKTEYE